MIPDERYAAREGDPHGSENPIRQLSPVSRLDSREIFRINQLPGSENIDLVRPDGADIVKGERDIEGQKRIWLHKDWAIVYDRSTGSVRQRSTPSPRAEELGRRLPGAQACVIGYFEKISSTRLNAFSAAACGAIPSFMMSTQPTAQTCSFWTWAYAGLRAQNCGKVGLSKPCVV